MANTKVEKRSTSADKTSIGFDYQFFYFISLILDLKKDEKIGYEVKDDIHIDLPNGGSIWMQLKHTLQESKSGKPINLTEKDLDIWKTFYNWCFEIQKKESIDEQMKIIENTSFILISNKTSNSNELINKISDLKSGKIRIRDFRNYIKTLRDNASKKNELKKYYSSIYSYKSIMLSI